MPLILVAVLVIVGLMIFFSFAGSVIHLVLMLFVAGLVGWVADAIVPGRMPYGWLGAIVAGLVGSWIGTLILGHFGPSLFGVPILPALLGAVILAFAVELIGKQLNRGRSIERY
jgi:uncharacterized membrane protein YeaQ/YmgE (transglycosylase-associated protein family)